jgi:mRNA-degrading endonuclease RelE of RelBE toxin-antitoxin system
MAKKGIPYEILISKKVQKNLFRLPQNARQRFTALAEQLREKGPVAYDWQNYSKLSEDRYHCHLTYSYVACWTHEKGTITIEVYYVGSRENAPY